LPFFFLAHRLFSHLRVDKGQRGLGGGITPIEIGALVAHHSQQVVQRRFYALESSRLLRLLD
jgi:hypothetical protein